MATTTGQAIALGNISQVPQDRPFTNAVINKQRLDLANQAQEAKRRSELEKNREAIAKSIDFKTSGVLPVYQDDVRDISATGMANAMAERDPIKRQSIIAKTQLELDNIKYNNDQLSSNLAAARTNGILPKEVIDVLYSPRDEANKRYETLIKQKPEYAALLGKTDNGAWALNNVVAMPMNDILGQAATRLKSGAIIDASKTRGIGGGQNEFTLVADPNEVAQEAQAIASSKDWGLNVMLNDPKTYSTYFDKAVNDAKKVAEQTGVEPTKEEIQHAAILGYTADALKKKAVYTERKGQPTPRADNDLSLNFGGGNPINPIGGAGNEIPITVQFNPKNGQPFTKQSKVVTGNPHSFHTVSVINTNSTNSINAETNEPLNNQVFEELKVGDAVAIPMAIIDIADPKTGRTYKKGQMIDEDALKGLTQAGMVEYVPMFKGVGTVKRGKTTQTISTLTPVKQTADAVISSQSKGDDIFTKRNIQAAIDDAVRLNADLNKKFKQPKSPKTTVYKATVTTKSR